MKKSIVSLIATMVLVATSVSSGAADPQRWVDEGWTRTDFAIHAVDYDDILSGGPPRDGIPAIDDPKFVTADQISDMGEEEPVVSVETGGEARAYPLRILMWHEIVNDEIAGIPVTVTYCPLCNSAVVYDRRVGERVLDFGTTGKLRNSDLVMYDRQTESWWQQFLGEAIVGEFTGTRLHALPARVESLALFRERHPRGRVLVPTNPNLRAYGSNPYQAYDGRAQPYGPLFSGPLPDYVEPMARVVSFTLDGEPHAVTLDLVRARGSIEIEGAVIGWTAGQNSALDARDISQGRDVGNVVVRQRTDDGLRDMVHDVVFAFVFHAFHPDSRIQTE